MGGGVGEGRVWSSHLVSAKESIFDSVASPRCEVRLALLLHSPGTIHATLLYVNSILTVHYKIPAAF